MPRRSPEELSLKSINLNSQKQLSPLQFTISYLPMLCMISISEEPIFSAKRTMRLPWIQSILILWTLGSDSGSLATSAIHKHGTGEIMLHGRIGTVGPGSLEILFWKAWEQRFTACSLGIERREGACSGKAGEKADQMWSMENAEQYCYYCYKDVYGIGIALSHAATVQYLCRELHCNNSINLVLPKVIQ